MSPLSIDRHVQDPQFLNFSTEPDAAHASYQLDLCLNDLGLPACKVEQVYSGVIVHGMCDLHKALLPSYLRDCGFNFFDIADQYNDYTS